MNIQELAAMYLRKWPQERPVPGNVYPGVRSLLMLTAKQGWSDELVRCAMETIASRDLAFTRRMADEQAMDWVVTDIKAASRHLDQILGHGKQIPKSFDALVKKAFTEELDLVRAYVRKHLQQELDDYAQ